jgi:NADH-quinone oxidoreductase subunit N
MMSLLAQIGGDGPFVPVEPIADGVLPDVAWSGLMPLLILSGSALMLLTITSVAHGRLPRRFHTVYTVLAGIATIVAAVPLWDRVQNVPAEGPFSTVAGAYGIDGFSLFLTVLLASSVILVALLADEYLLRESMTGPEPYVLLMLSASGGIIMASANDLIVLFLGLEILSIAVYVLAAMDLKRVQSQEAGMKYFLLGALASAFFLYGIALTYGATGTTSLLEIRAFLGTFVLTDDGLLLGGFALLLVGLGFKVAAAPFHSWTPDVYQGAPSPIVAYMASGVKAAGFAALLRVFWVTFGSYRTDWQPVMYGLAIATLVVGSFMAIVQSDVKRMLAYSSISHAGYLLVGVQAASDTGTSAVLFYLAAYGCMVIGSFAVVTVVAGEGDARTSLSDLSGLANRRPILAVAFTVFLLGQAGVPFTSGFFAKFYVIDAAVQSDSYWLAVVAMLVAVVAAFVYLRIRVSMWLEGGDTLEGPERVAARATLPIPFGTAVVLIVTVGFTLVFGLWPDPVVQLARDAVPALVAAG